MRADQTIATLLLLAVASCKEAPVSASCPAVLSGWTVPKDGMDHEGWYTAISVKDGKIYWAGEVVSESEFQARLKHTTTLSPTMHVLFDPAGAASCKKAELIRDEIDRLADCQGEGLCGQGEEADFKRLRDNGTPYRVKMERYSRN